MEDKNKTKEQLINEVGALRQQLSEFQALESEWQRTEAARQQCHRELSLLNRVGQVCSSALDLDQVLTLVLEEVRRLLEADICSLWLLDPETKEPVCRRAVGFRYELVQGWRLASGQGLVGWVARNGKSLMVPDTRNEARHFKDIDQRIGLELRSILSVPLRVKQAVIGVLNVTNTAVDHFNPTDLTLLESLAAMAAIAIENTRLYEQAQQEFSERQQAEVALKARAHQQAIVAALGQHALAGDDVAQLVEQAVTFVAQTLEVEYCLVLELLPDQDALLLRAGVGWPEGLIGQVTVQADPVSQVGYTLLSSEPVIVEDLRTEGRFRGPPLLQDQGVISGMSAIIDGQDWPFGVLGAYATRRQTFSQDDIHFLQAVANVLATAIERRRAEEALRESEAKNKAILDAIPDLMFHLSPEGELLDFKAGNVDDLFVPSQKIIRSNISDTMPPEFVAQCLHYIRKTLDSGAVQTFEYQLPLAQGIQDFEARLAVSGANEVLGIIRNVTERKASEEMWRRYEFIVNASKDLMTLIGQNYTYEAVNEAYCQAHAKTRTEIIGRSVAEVWGQEQYVSQIKVHLDRSFAGQEEHFQDWFEFATLGRHCFDVLYYPYRNTAGTVTHVVVVSRDITEQKQLEDQLRQAQKMEAIGQLAGGVAHDFNNLLTAIMGYTGMALEMIDPDSLVLSDLQGIQKTAQRAASLTHQLLAFARRQIVEPTVLNPNELIVKVDKMLRRLIGADIELVTLLAPDVGQVKVDPNQFEQVLVNLVINARDAMPDGGILTLKTANVLLDQEYTRRHVEVVPGEYVMLIVGDTGIGMTEEVKAHLFEPFFTTKEVGQGTGLGLATSFGVVKQSQGHIQVYSEPAQGSIFEIYLPQVEEVASPLSKLDASESLPLGTETILLVEDEAAVRDLAARLLRQQGYTVLEAANGDEALRVAQEQASAQIHLLLTDVVMPQMGGPTLANHLRAVRPDLKVLFMSGYTSHTFAHPGLLESDMAFLQKPFSSGLLARKVREVLDLTG